MTSSRPPADTPYGRTYLEGRQALRQVVLDAASQLLEAEGPHALSMRRIAKEVGCSPSLLYTMFSGKAGVAEGLWREGFERLGRTLEAVGHDRDPFVRLGALSWAYRENALANRAYYTIMFQRPIPGFEPALEAYDESVQVFQILVDAVTACIDAGIFRPEDPAHIAGVLWAAAHGAVSLELAGYEGDVAAEARYRDLVVGAAHWFVTER